MRFHQIPRFGGVHLFGNPNATGFSNTKSLSNASTSKYLARTQGAGTSRRKFTLSAFVKIPSSFTSETVNSVYLPGTLQGLNIDPGNGFLDLIAGDGEVISTVQTLSANTWYNVLAQVDTTQATATNRVKLYLNGVDVTDTGASAYPSQDNDTGFGQNTLEERTAVVRSGTATWFFDEIAKFDGQIYGYADVTVGGVPKDLSGLTFGSQGYWLSFETGVASTVGTDSSGNGLTFTNNNFVNGDFSATVP